MFPLKSSIMMICIIMNIVHASYEEDYQKCLAQLRHAFDYNYDSASSCLRHSIKYYVKGQRIPVPAYTLIDENQNVDSTMVDNEEHMNDGTQNDSGVDDEEHTNDGRQNDKEDVITKWLAEELKRYTTPEFEDDYEGQQNVEEDAFTKWMAVELKKDKISEFWDDYEGQQNVEDSSQYGFGSSQYGFGSSENDFSSSENDFSSSYFGFYSKEDFHNYLDSKNWIRNEGQQNFNGSSQTVPDNIILIAEDNVENVKTQQDYPLNYAELYHKELETMISGKRVLNRIQYCIKFFLVKNVACQDALKTFGDYSISAVRIAFKYYTIDECEKLKSIDSKYTFIHSYMVYLSKLSKAGLSTKPSKFCVEKMMAKYKLKEIPKI